MICLVEPAEITLTVRLVKMFPTGKLRTHVHKQTDQEEQINTVTE